MRKLLFILLFSLPALSKQIGITHQQFCHFSYTIYKGCYQRGLIPGVDCNTLSEGIKFGKGFNKKQVEFIKESCKTGCFLGKNKFKIQNENVFVENCLK